MLWIFLSGVEDVWVFLSRWETRKKYNHEQLVSAEKRRDLQQEFRAMATVLQSPPAAKLHQLQEKDLAGPSSDEQYRSRAMRQGGGGVNCQDCGNQAKEGLSVFEVQDVLQEPRVRVPDPRLEVGHFPVQYNSEAVFRCVRVSSTDDADHDQLAYQTAVNIGGHVFKGILYDQGPYGGGESSSRGGGGGGQPLSLTTAVTTATTAATTSYHQGVNMLDPSLYSAPLNAFMAGTQFFPPPRP
ncbi:hypothetical protein Acr_04g0008500 [Actinidia rufa]|uniref:Uncharacterized protein n=1 Tax=Actinidia rufa TaxID=165716 RepID=A0A7J0EII9_9ERIC|nr:hypothetical protein Acr_04g0008500 [Actinidia rufa]